MADEAEFRSPIRSTSAGSVVRRAAERCRGGELVLFYWPMLAVVVEVSGAFRRFADSTSPP